LYIIGGVLVQLQLSWAHGGVEINWLKFHDTLRINPEIGNYQKIKNASQAYMKKARKTWKMEEVWLRQEEGMSNKNWTLRFLYLLLENRL